MKPTLRAILFLLFLTLSGCMTIHRTSPMMWDNRVDPLSLRRGEATSTVFLGIITMGDASLQTALQNGKIRRIHHVEEETKYFFWFLMYVHKTVVWGDSKTQNELNQQ